MNIRSAISKAERIIEYGEDHYWAPDYLDPIVYLVEYCKTMHAVHTTHDAQAEMDCWDEFFAERKAAADGQV